MSDDLKKGKWAEKGKFVDTIDEWAEHVLDVSPKVEKEVTDKLFSGKSLDTIDLLTGYCKDCSDKKKNLTANSSTDNKNIILAERDYASELTNTIDTIGDLLQRNNGVRNSLRTQQIKDNTKTVGKELFNNGMGNALRFLWKPQTYAPSWSKSVKDPKDTEDSMPKLLRKYGAYCFEYALANDTRREKIPNIDKLKQDIIKEYGNVKEANSDFYKLLTMLRKVSLNDEEITSVINQDVNVTNFQNIRKKFEDIGEDKQRIFLDIATKKIRYILKYWVTTSRQSENEKSFIPDMTNVIKNISDLNTSVILDKGKLIDSNMVKISLSQTYQGLMKEIKNKYIPALIKNKSYSNSVQNYLIMCAQILEIITNSTLTVDGVMSALSAEGVFSKYKQDMYISIKDKEISIAQLIHLTEEIVNKRFDNIRQQLAELLNGVLKDYTSSSYDDYDENITKQTLNKFIEKIMKNN